MMCSLVPLFLLGSTYIISFFAVLSQTHPQENNSFYPPTHSLQNVDTYHNLISLNGTLSVANKLVIKKLPNALPYNNKPNTYVSPFRLKSTLSNYYVEDFHKLIPIFKSNSTLLQSIKTESDFPGSSSGTQSFVSNKVHKLQDIPPRGGSSRSLGAPDLKQSMTSRVKRNVGELFLFSAVNYKLQK